MIWKFYVDLEKYLTKDTTANDLIEMVANLDNLRDYIKESDNILFKDIEVTKPVSKQNNTNITDTLEDGFQNYNK